MKIFCTSYLFPALEIDLIQIINTRKHTNHLQKYCLIVACEKLHLTVPFARKGD